MFQENLDLEDIREADHSSLGNKDILLAIMVTLVPVFQVVVNQVLEDIRVQINRHTLAEDDLKDHHHKQVVTMKVIQVEDQVVQLFQLALRQAEVFLEEGRVEVALPSHHKVPPILNVHIYLHELVNQGFRIDLKILTCWKH